MKVINDHRSEFPIAIKKPEKIQGFTKNLTHLNLNNQQVEVIFTQLSRLLSIEPQFA